MLFIVECLSLKMVGFGDDVVGWLWVIFVCVVFVFSCGLFPSPWLSLGRSKKRPSFRIWS